MPMGTLTNSTQRQEAYVTSRPPAMSPTAAPTPLIAAYTPIARLRGGPSGNAVAISASAVGATIAPPTPCSARAASSQPGEVANPPASDAAENSSSPAVNIRRRPNRSPARPPSSSRPPNVSAYALITHSRPLPEKPSAAWMCGRATLTTVASSTTISCAVAMRSSATPGVAAFVPGDRRACGGELDCHAVDASSRGRLPSSGEGGVFVPTRRRGRGRPAYRVRSSRR